MSDYLNNLLAKTLNLTEVIQPRLMTLFEPPNSMDTSALRHPSEPEMEDEKPFAEKPSDDSSPTRLLERLPVKYPPESQVLPKLQRPLPDPESAPIRPLMHQKDQIPTPPLPAAKQPSIVAHPTVRESKQDMAPEWPMPQVAAAAPTHIVPPPDTTQEDRPHVLKPAIPYIEPSPGQATHPSMIKIAVVQPQATPYIEPKAQAAPEIISTPKPAPSIQVTIGRVEVRAMPPPARPPQKKRSAQTVMTLEEYLRRRTKGDRA